MIVMTRTLFTIASFMVVPGLASAQQPVQPTRDEPLVVTAGTAVLQATPDRAWVNISAESRASNPRDAQNRNAQAMGPVQEKLRAAGVPSDAIRTIIYDLQYEWDYVDNRRVGRGYVARNTIEVRIDNIGRVADILDIAVGSGATSVGGIRFDVKDRTNLEREVLRLAVADARGRAEAAAAGAGRAIDRVLRIEEQGVISPPMPIRPVAFREAAQVAEAPAISAGQIEVRAQVTLTAVLK
jgi:hypothetical protein